MATGPTGPVGGQGAFWNNWKQGAIPTTGSTISNPNASGAYSGYKGQQGATSTAVDPDISELLNLPSEDIAKLSALLKSAGYIRNTYTKYNKKLGDAYIMAKQEWITEANRSGRDLSLSQFLTENSTPTVGKAGRPSTQRVERVDDNTTADARVAKVFESLGITPTSDQIKEWRKKLQAEQKKNPTVTKYTTKDGVQTAATTGGLDDEFWLEKNISKVFKNEIQSAKLKDPLVQQRATEKSVYDQVTKGLTGTALTEAANKTVYGRNINETLNRIKEYALEAGATIADDEARTIATQLYDQGMEGDAATIRSMLRGKIVVGKDGTLGGRAGGNLTDLKKVAAANGLDLTKAFGGQVQNWLQNIEQGESIETYKQIIRNVAKLGMPDKVGALLDQGVDLETIYTPYRRQMASLLEVDEDAIKLDDPLLRAAIGPDKEMTIYDFKKAVRKDPRWQYTDNAKQEVSDIALQVLRDFGFQG